MISLLVLIGFLIKYRTDAFFLLLRTSPTRFVHENSGCDENWSSLSNHSLKILYWEAERYLCQSNWILSLIDLTATLQIDNFNTAFKTLNLSVIKYKRQLLNVVFVISIWQLHYHIIILGVHRNKYRVMYMNLKLRGKPVEYRTEKSGYILQINTN